MDRTNTPILAIMLPSLRGGGAERVMLNIANRLAKKQYEVDIVLVSATGPYLADLSKSINVVDLRSRRSITAMPSLIRYLRRRRPQTIVCSMPHINIAGLVARFFSQVMTRVVIVEHNTISQTLANSPSIKTKILILLMRSLYRYSHRIVAVSKGVAADLELNVGLPNDSVSVIYNPVVTSKMEQLAQESLLHPWFTRSSPPVVLGIGRLTYAKNFSLLIESFHDLRKQIDARLMILGEGPDRATLVNLISSLGLSRDVLLPGFVPNPYSFLKNCSIFVLSSRWEGLPTVLIEALACGAPVVSTDCPSGPREILQDGKLGALVPTSDKLALTKAIRNGLANGPRPLPKQTLAVYRTEYAVNQYERIIN